MKIMGISSIDTTYLDTDYQTYLDNLEDIDAQEDSSAATTSSTATNASISLDLQKLLEDGVSTSISENEQQMEKANNTLKESEEG